MVEGESLSAPMSTSSLTSTAKREENDKKAQRCRRRGEEAERESYSSATLRQHLSNPMENGNIADSFLSINDEMKLE